VGSFWRRGTELSGACVGWINDDSTCDGLSDRLMCVNTSVLIFTTNENVNEMNSTRS
jgi:hypothetical protein